MAHRCIYSTDVYIYSKITQKRKKLTQNLLLQSLQSGNLTGKTSSRRVGDPMLQGHVCESCDHMVEPDLRCLPSAVVTHPSRCVLIPWE